MAANAKPGFGICCRIVLCVAAGLAVETAAALVIITAVFAYKALVARPGLDECAVNADVFTRETVFLSATSSTWLKSSMTASCAIRLSRFLDVYGGLQYGIVPRPSQLCSSKQQAGLGMRHELASELTLQNNCNSMARSSFSGAMLGKPPFTSYSFIPANSPSIFKNASLTTWRNDHKG